MDGTRCAGDAVQPGALKLSLACALLVDRPFGGQRITEAIRLFGGQFGTRPGSLRSKGDLRVVEPLFTSLDNALLVL